MKAVVWSLMMLVWLAGLIFGLWWVWPHFARLTLTGEAVMAALWLVMGLGAWLLALNLGLKRYWRR